MDFGCDEMDDLGEEEFDFDAGDDDAVNEGNEIEDINDDQPDNCNCDSYV